MNLRRTDHGVVLVSCYELGRQPLGIATPAAFLRRAGFEPRVLDLAARRLDDLSADAWREAWLVAVAVPMHTALHLGVGALAGIRERAPRATIVFHGLYATLNSDHLFARGVDAVLGGEAEAALVAVAESLAEHRTIEGIDGVGTPGTPSRPSIERLEYVAPDRAGLPPHDAYAALEIDGRHRRAAAVEATRGCKHRCRHCPIPAVYDGRFVAVPVDVVLEDVDRLVADGVRHLTFADPDFLNGPTHAMRVARAIHAAHPSVTFDITTKVEHVLAHRDLLPELASLGAVFAVTAVESLDDRVLSILHKGHTGQDARAAVALLEGAGISARPSLMPFSPWESIEGYGAILDWIESGHLEDRVDPVQLSIRLLVPPGSLLERDPAMTPHLRGLDAERFQHRWEHPDPRMDRLQREVDARAREAALTGEPPRATVDRIRRAWARTADRTPPRRSVSTPPRLDRAGPPRLTEPWFC